MKNDEIELKLTNINTSPILFFKDFLSAFEFPNSSIEKGKSDLLDSGFSFIGKKITFVLSSSKNIDLEYEKWKRSKKELRTRFVFFLNENSFYSLDIQRDIAITDSLKNISNYVDFFLPLIGIESEAAVDVGKPNLKYGELIASFRNSLVFANEESNQAFIDDYVQLVILLSFCDYFLSTRHLLKEEINKINNEPDIKKALLWIINNSADTYNFDLINVLDQNSIQKIHLSRESIAFIKKIFAFDLSMVSTDAIGSILQNIKNGEGIYQNFTSSDNIQKVLRPLFLGEWKEIALNSNCNEALLNLKKLIEESFFLDANTNTGSFLVVAYRELFFIVESINERLGIKNKPLSPEHFIGLERDLITSKYAKMLFAFSVYELTNNIEYFRMAFDNSIQNSSPLLLDWSSIVKYGAHTYIFGNIDYSGARKMTANQKNEKESVFSGMSGIGDLDYSACWFYKSSLFLRTHPGACAFVCTNSILQGEQAGVLWPQIFSQGIEIYFAYKPFKWGNGCKNTTGVTVVIIGLKKGPDSHIVYCGTETEGLDYINPYYTNARVVVSKSGSPISPELPSMIKGNMPYDGGLISKFSLEEKNNIIRNYPSSKRLFKKIVGSDEFINDIDRYCLWIEDEDLDFALSIPPIRERINENRSQRLAKSDKAARELANRPHQFREMNKTNSMSVVVPSVSSENRPYIPMGLVGKDVVVSNLAFVIYDCEPWILGVLMSKMHNLWIRTVCGRLEMRLRYSNKLGYNTFPIPTIDNDEKIRLNKCVAGILAARENHSEMTLGTMYKELPSDLAAEHLLLDLEVERIYSNKPFMSDEERVACMLNMYKEKTNGKR